MGDFNALLVKVTMTSPYYTIYNYIWETEEKGQVAIGFVGNSAYLQVMRGIQ